MTIMRSTVLLSCVLCPIVAGAQLPDPAARPLAITHVTVIDVLKGARLRDQTVVVAGNRITALGAASAIPVPPGAIVVDGRGKFLVPGLWDMHVHSAVLAARELPVFAALGITGVRNMHTTSDTALELTAAIKQRLRSGELTGPRFVANGPIVDGARPQWRGSVVVSTSEAGQRVVDSLARGGADFVKVYNGLPRTAYFAIAEASRRRGLPFVGHVPLAVSAQEASNAGQRSIEHLSGFDRACSPVGDSIGAARADDGPLPLPEFLRILDVLARTSQSDRCVATAAVFKRNGTWVTPTLVNSWIHVAGDSILADSAAMAVIPTMTRERWRTIVARDAQFDTTAERVFSWSLRAVRTLRDAGVPILAGTDVGNPLLVPGYSLHTELALLVRAGLTTHEALRAATVTPAEFLGLADSLGTVAVGKVADLLLLDADPLDDIRNTRRIRAVALNGRLLDREALDRLLSAAEADGRR